MQGRKYSGDLYARKYGSSDGLIKMGNVTEFSTSQEVKTDTLKSTGKYDYGQALSAEVSPQPIEISLKFNTFDKHALLLKNTPKPDGLGCFLACDLKMKG